MNTADRQLMKQALDAMRRYQVKRQDFDTFANEITTLNDRLAHCDRCGKKLGGEGDIHTCTPDPIGDAQSALIAEMAAQPEKESVIFCMHWEDRWGVNHYVDPKEPHPAQAKPLYTTPPAAAPVQTNCRHCGGPDNVICAGQCKQSTPPAAEQEPVMIYHGGCTIDCGEHGHHSMEMLKLIPAGTKLYDTPPAAAPVQLVAGLEQCEFDDECEFCKSPQGGSFTRLIHNAEDCTEAEFYICGDCVHEALRRYTTPPAHVQEPVAKHRDLHSHMMVVAHRAVDEASNNGRESISQKEVVRAICKAIQTNKNLLAKLTPPAAAQPAPVQEPVAGLHAVYFRNNWDGEGELEYLLAYLSEKGEWTLHENGAPLIEFNGDEIIKTWPLTFESATPPAAQRKPLTVDCIGLALDLETQSKRVESQTVERAMIAAANGLRIIEADHGIKENT
jgi:hypothetical protein